jgi:hypothetical protein
MTLIQRIFADFFKYIRDYPRHPRSILVAASAAP